MLIFHLQYKHQLRHLSHKIIIEQNYYPTIVDNDLKNSYSCMSERQ